MLTSEYLDTLLYHLASFVALSGFSIFHCYFMLRESYDDVISIDANFSALSEQGYTIIHQILYNILWV